jgi:periplasmic protein TonB
MQIRDKVKNKLPKLVIIFSLIKANSLRNNGLFKKDLTQSKENRMTNLGSLFFTLSLSSLLFLTVSKSNRVMKNLKRVFLLALVAISFFTACKNDKKASTTADTGTAVEKVKSAAEIAAEEAAAREAALETARLDSIAAATAAKEAAAMKKAEAAAAAAAAKKGVKKPTTAPKVVAAKPKPKPQPKATKPAPPPANASTQGEGQAISAAENREISDDNNPNVLKRPGRDNVLTITDVKPSFPGGDGALNAYLSKNIKYPTMAKEDGIKGTVFVKFVIEKDGTVDDVAISKGVHPLLDAEAARVIRSMPKWTAGKMAGQAVATQFTVPVKFQLVD